MGDRLREGRHEKNLWFDDFATGAQFGKDLEKDYADIKAVLTELGLARQ